MDGWVDRSTGSFVSCRVAICHCGASAHPRIEEEKQLPDCLSLVPGSLFFFFLFFSSSLLFDQQPPSFLFLSHTVLHSHSLLPSPLRPLSPSLFSLFFLPHSFHSLVITTTKDTATWERQQSSVLPPQEEEDNTNNSSTIHSRTSPATATSTATHSRPARARSDGPSPSTNSPPSLSTTTRTLTVL